MPQMWIPITGFSASGPFNTTSKPSATWANNTGYVLEKIRISANKGLNIQQMGISITNANSYYWTNTNTSITFEQPFNTFIQPNQSITVAMYYNNGEGGMSGGVFGGYSADFTATDVFVTALPSTKSINRSFADVKMTGNIPYTCTERGFQYGITQTAENTVSATGSFSSGDFSLNLTGVTVGTTYWVRAYAVSASYGTEYGTWTQYTVPEVGNGTISSLGNSNDTAQIVRLDDTYSMAVYIDSGASSNGKAVLLTTSGDQITTVGTPFTWWNTNAISGSELAATRIDDTKVFVAYRVTNGSNYELRFIVLSVSGTTISAGSSYLSQVDTSTTDRYRGISVTSLNTTSVLVSWKDANTSTGNIVVYRYTISGTTISLGGSVTVAVNSNTSNFRTSIVTLDSTHALLISPINATPITRAWVITYSGTLSAGTGFDAFAAVTNMNYADLAVIGTNTVMAVGFNGNFGDLRAQVLTVSGTTISGGTTVTIDTTLGHQNHSVASGATNEAIVLYSKNSPAGLSLKKLTVSGTTITVGTIRQLNNFAYNNSIIWDMNQKQASAVWGIYKEFNGTSWALKTTIFTTVPSRVNVDSVRGTKYSIRNLVDSQRSTSFAVRNFVDKVASTKYAIRNNVDSIRSTSWSMIQTYPVDSVRGTSYKILENVDSIRQTSFALRNFVDTTKTAKYAIRNFVDMATRSTSYEIQRAMWAIKRNIGTTNVDSTKLAIASSPDGTNLATIIDVASSMKNVLLSTNGGDTWTNIGSPTVSTLVSRDVALAFKGNKLFALYETTSSENVFYVNVYDLGTSTWATEYQVYNATGATSPGYVSLKALTSSNYLVGTIGYTMSATDVRVDVVKIDSTNHTSVVRTSVYTGAGQVLNKPGLGFTPSGNGLVANYFNTDKVKLSEYNVTTNAITSYETPAFPTFNKVETTTADFATGTLSNATANNNNLELSSSQVSYGGFASIGTTSNYFPASLSHWGYEFRVGVTALTVNSLRFWAVDTTNTKTITIWRVSDQVQIATSTVTPTNTGWFTTNITPVTLAANTNYAITVGGYDNVNNTKKVTTWTTDSKITYITGRQSSSGGFPTGTYTGEIRGLADIVYVQTEYPLSGNRVSPAYDISVAKFVSSATISWTRTLPTSTNVTIETSIDNGATWQTATNGGTISGLATGTNLTGKTLKIRETLTTTDKLVTPQLNDLTINIKSHPTLSGNVVGNYPRVIRDKIDNTKTYLAFIETSVTPYKLMVAFYNGTTLTKIDQIATLAATSIYKVDLELSLDGSNILYVHVIDDATLKYYQYNGTTWSAATTIVNDIGHAVSTTANTGFAGYYTPDLNNIRWVWKDSSKNLHFGAMKTTLAYVDSLRSTNYAIRNFVDGVRTGKYSIRNTVDISPRTTSYAIRNNVDNDRSTSFTIRNNVDSNRSTQFTIRNFVDNFRATKYPIRNFVDQNPRSTSYAIRNNVDSTRSTQYTIRSFVDTVRTTKYVIRNYVDSGRAAKYSIRNFVDIDIRSTKYSIRNNVDTIRSTKFKIRAFVDSVRTTKYGIRNFVDSNRTGKYAIRNFVDMTTRSTSYSIRNRVDSVRSSKYTIRENVDTIRRTMYTLGGYVSVDSVRGSKYAIRNNIDNTKSTKYSIRNNVDITPRSTSYAIRNNVDVVRKTTYTIRENVTTERTTSYAIRNFVDGTRKTSYSIRVFVYGPTKTTSYSIRNTVDSVRSTSYEHGGWVDSVRSTKYRIQAPPFGHVMQVSLYNNTIQEKLYVDKNIITTKRESIDENSLT